MISNIYLDHDSTDGQNLQRKFNDHEIQCDWRAKGARLKHQAEEAALSCVQVDGGHAVGSGPEVRTAFDIFGSELPDEFFADVFNQPRQRGSLEKDC